MLTTRLADGFLGEDLLWLLQALLLVFYVLLIAAVLRHPWMFVDRYGRQHRLAGLALLTWLTLGATVTGVGSIAHLLHPRLQAGDGKAAWWRPSEAGWLGYDILLGLLGVAATASAAHDFRRAHSQVKNLGSGTLEEKATVTYSEMVEHAFYQGLNLVQVVALQAFGMEFMRTGLWRRAVLLLLATLPWQLRGCFPVNKFSDNYTKGQKASTTSAVLYRIKKYQYLLYKHGLLHGFNIGVALTIPGTSIATTQSFSLYWVCINTSYVMEFFLQTLIKKGYLSQTSMLGLQQLLMLTSSAAGLEVMLRNTFIPAAALSLSLNFMNRHNEVLNTAVVFGCSIFFLHQASPQRTFTLFS